MAGPQWMPMPIRSGSIEFGPQRSVEIVEPHGHQPGGGERLAAAGLGAALDPEQRHDAVADELVDAPSRRFDRASHRREIAVEDEHHVIGKPALGERGEAADVGEQDRDLALAALREVDPAPPVRGVRERRQQRRHLDRAARPQLAGEADIGRCADAAEYAQLVLGRGIDAVDLAAHPDAASRAAAAAAAYRGMRDPGEAARLEHAGAGRDLDDAAVRIADAHEAVAALPDAAGEARQQYRPDHAGEKPAERIGDRLEGALGLR